MLVGGVKLSVSGGSGGSSVVRYNILCFGVGVGVGVYIHMYIGGGLVGRGFTSIEVISTWLV